MSPCIMLSSNTWLKLPIKALTKHTHHAIFPVLETLICKSFKPNSDKYFPLAAAKIAINEAPMYVCVNPCKWPSPVIRTIKG